MKAVGVSNYGPRQLERIYTYLERRGIPLASAQACCMQACFTTPGAVPVATMDQWNGAALPCHTVSAWCRCI